MGHRSRAPPKRGTVAIADAKLGFKRRAAVSAWPYRPSQLQKGSVLGSPRRRGLGASARWLGQKFHPQGLYQPRDG